MARLQTWKRHLGTAVLMGGMSVPFAVSAQTLSVVATPSPAVVGSPVALSVQIAGVTDLFAHQFSLSFDPSILQATGVAQGGFLPTGGATFFDIGTIDNTTGKVAFVLDTLVGLIPGVSGSGSLASLGFNVVGTGTTALTFSDLLFLDSSLAPIGVTASAGMLQAVPEPANWAMLGFGLAGLLAMRRRSGLPLGGRPSL